MNETDEKTKFALGENYYQTNENDVFENEKKYEDEGYFGKPEKYDYSQVKLPEDYCYNEELLNEFNELAAKYDLSQKGANELMSMAVRLTKLNGENYSKNAVEQQKRQVDEFKKALVNDREIGGGNLERTMRTANIAYTQFADDDVQQMLQETGLNCHPKIVKMFYNIGKKMQNDSIYSVNAGAFPKENREDILFPTM